MPTTSAWRPRWRDSSSACLCSAAGRSPPAPLCLRRTTPTIAPPRAQAAASLAEAKARLTNLEKAGRETEIAQAKADMTDMIATRDQIARDLARNEILLRSGAATRQTVDQQSAQLASASAHVNASQAKLQQIAGPHRPPVRDRRPAGGSGRATARHCNRRIGGWRSAHVTAPIAGEVADTYAVPGEMIGAGAPVVELLPPGNILVRFFIPETALGAIRMGEHLSIGCDNCARELNAKVTFVSPQPEYTPPVIYSEQTRDKLVYMIEAHPDLDQATMLKPGQPVTVRVAP